jgi:hypothetical protein
MEELDPDKLKGPGGLTLRQIHQQVKVSTARDNMDRARDSSAPTVRWWRRFVRSIRYTKVKS